ncbi:MAG: hypothetical protein H7Z19_01350 [Chitinophagaceae bacterium]|nr:hypothetical protein [Rubrivivax sp.]
MSKSLRPALALCACLLSGGASAQAAETPAAAVAASAPAAAASQPKAGPASRDSRVIEDDKVRIEEVRVRGQLQRVTVHNKVVGGSYEIIVGNGGRDPSQDRGAAGQRAWSVFSF